MRSVQANDTNTQIGGASAGDTAEKGQEADVTRPVDEHLTTH
jgi:hypothetical protein